MTGRGGQIDNGPLQSGYVLLVGIPDHRNDQAAFESNSDADIDVAIVDNVLAVDRSVEDWKRA